MVADQEGEDVSLLELTDDVDGDLRGRRGANDGRESRHASVDELNAERAQNGIGDEALPGVVVRLRALEVAQNVEDLLGQERRDAGVESLREVRQPELVGRRRVRDEVVPKVLQDGLELAEPRYFLSQQ